MITEREICSYLLNLGIKVRPNAIDAIKTQFRAVYNDPDGVERLIEKWSRFDVIDIKDIEEKDLVVAERDEENCAIYVFDVFEPNMKEVFSVQSQKFLPARERPSISAAAQSKASMFIERFQIMHSKVKFHPSFRTSANTSAELLNSIDSLIGCRGEKIVLGILTKIDGIHWILEDLNNNVKLQFLDVEKTSGFFCEGCIVLVQGELNDGIFKVSCIAQPPLQWISTSPYPDLPQDWQLPWPEHSLILTLSNVHLDDPHVLSLLDKLFEGYSSYSNIMFILIGNFSSQKNPDVYKYQSMFESLLRIIQKYEILESSSMWVFIPGPNDPGLGEFMPRQRIPAFFVQPLSDLRRCKFSSNPTRISYCGKKILVARAEQLRKMQRTSAVEPNLEETPEPEAHLAHTLIKQAHVCPALFNNVLPDFDYALRIDHSIDILILAESTQGFQVNVEGVAVYNPGHFSRYSSFIALTGKNLDSEICYLE